ncbi:MAG: hypothetical protein ACLFU9_03110 [Candidatus Bathyarchaeia archaeon]
MLTATTHLRKSGAPYAQKAATTKPSSYLCSCFWLIVIVPVFSVTFTIALLAKIFGRLTSDPCYVDPFNQLCETPELSKEDLERIRLVFTATWKYRELFREYEGWEEIKHRVDEIEKMLEILKETRAKKSEDA